jgi:hypothetical protein
MNWFRRSRWGSCLAQFALALQLVLSFGHVHLAANSRHSLGPHFAASRDMHKASGGHHHPHLPAAADDYCPLCALIHLAGTLLPSAPPSAMPAVSARASHGIVAHFDLSAASAAHFQARAPPLA